MKLKMLGEHFKFCRLYIDILHLYSNVSRLIYASARSSEIDTKGSRVPECGPPPKCSRSAPGYINSQIEV